MRYFLEVSYRGSHYSGFQSQKNANTIQTEVEKAFKVLLKEEIQLTGSSRTDTGVHALQNYFHFDTKNELSPQLLYNLNALLPGDIAMRNLHKVRDEAHCRFDAITREYKYYVYQKKNPFLEDKAYYYPYTLDLQLMQKAATIIKEYSAFTSFSKRNTQVKSFTCDILESYWTVEGECFVYNVKANRFLRGMVRALVATMLKVGRNKVNLDNFRTIIKSQNCTLADFSAPPNGLFLVQVAFPGKYFN